MAVSGKSVRTEQQIAEQVHCSDNVNHAVNKWGRRDGIYSDINRLIRISSFKPVGEAVMSNTYSKPNSARGVVKSVGAAIVDIILGPSSQQEAMAQPARTSAVSGALPPVHIKGDVTYVSGGGSYVESLSFHHAEHLWPLSLEFLMSEPGSGNHYDEINVEIFEGHGISKLNATASGPFMLVKLPLGHYHMKAKLRNQLIERFIYVQPGHTIKQSFNF